MQLEPFANLSWAYQLHYYLCFRTHRRRGFFSNRDQIRVISDALSEICLHHDYHLLRFKVYPNHLRCLLSLRPEHTISTVIQTLKTNLARSWCTQFAISPPLWARGYLARSVGRVRIEVVRQYLDQQAEHHGYASRVRPPVVRWRAREPVILRAAHASFELNHHLVLATRYRAGIFNSKSGEALATYWQTVAAKRGFAIDQISVVPDHIHLLVRTVPKMSIETCVLSLMNNGQYFMGKHFPQALVREKINQLWQASAYAGTCGQVTTALVKAFLSQEE
jgi:putative transposase